MTPLLASCLAPEPPVYEDPSRIPPVLNLQEAVPPVTEVMRVSAGDIQNVRVGVRSEDLGDDLVALPFLDYLLPGEEPQVRDFRQLPFVNASTFDDTERDVSFDWSVPSGKQGCHQFTLVVTHFGNLCRQTDPECETGQLLRTKSDVALATWWVAIDDDEVTLASCPTNTGGGS